MKGGVLRMLQDAAFHNATVLNRLFWQPITKWVNIICKNK